KSLLWQEEGNTGEPRFTMLDTVREYALEHFMAGDELQTLRRRHASYFLAMAEAAERASAGPWQAGWLAQLAQERENLRVALQWARETGEVHSGVGVAKALWHLGLLALMESDIGKPGAAPSLLEPALGDARRRV